MASDEASCAGIIADLAREYEKSCALLESIEDSLRNRAQSEASKATVGLAEDSEDDEVDPADQEDSCTASEHNESSPPKQKIGFRARLSQFFSRSRSLPRDTENDEVEERKRRISVVKFTGPTLPDCKEGRQSSSFQRHNAASQSTSARRQMPRPSVDVRQQQLYESADGSEDRSVSSSSMAGFPARRRNLGRISVDINGPISRAIQRSTLDISNHGSRSTSDVSNHGSRSTLDASYHGGRSTFDTSYHGGRSQVQFLNMAPAGTAIRKPNSPGAEQGSSNISSPSGAPVLYGRSDSLCRRSMPVPTPFNPSSHVQQQQNFHQASFSGTGLASLASIGNLAPSPSIAVSMRNLLLSTSTSGNTSFRPLLANSSSSSQYPPFSVRPDSMPGLSPSGTGASLSFLPELDDIPGTGQGGVSKSSSGGERSDIGATGVVVSATTSAICVQLPSLTCRSKSVKLAQQSFGLGAGGGSCGSSPTAAGLAAVQSGLLPRRLQSCRFGDREAVSCGADFVMQGQYVSGSGSMHQTRTHQQVEGCGAVASREMHVPTPSAGGFRGTLNLI